MINESCTYDLPVSGTSICKEINLLYLHYHQTIILICNQLLQITYVGMANGKIRTFIQNYGIQHTVCYRMYYKKIY